MYEEEAPAYDDLTTYWFALFDRSFLHLLAKKMLTVVTLNLLFKDTQEHKCIYLKTVPISAFEICECICIMMTPSISYLRRFCIYIK